MTFAEFNDETVPYDISHDFETIVNELDKPTEFKEENTVDDADITHVRYFEELMDIEYQIIIFSDEDYDFMTRNQLMISLELSLWGVVKNGTLLENIIDFTRFYRRDDFDAGKAAIELGADAYRGIGATVVVDQLTYEIECAYDYVIDND